LKLTEKQQQAQHIIAGPASHIMLFGGSRSGKTFLHMRNVIFRALKAPGSRHAVLRFRFNHVKASIVLDTFPKVLSLAFPGVEAKIDKTDWYAKLGESQIWFGGLDDKERTEKILGQEHCVDPAALILTADLQWKRADALVVGEELIGFPERLFGNQTLKGSFVERSEVIQASKFRVVTDRGSTIVSGEHRFVEHPSAELTSNRPLRWTMAQELKLGARIKFACSPWESKESHDIGWLSGMFDGEGCVSQNGQVSIVQKPGAVFDKLRDVAGRLGLRFSVQKQKASGCYSVLFAGLWSALKALGIARPVRLLPKARALWDGRRPFNGHGDNHFARVISIEPLGVGDVVALGTSSKTFIADGFLGHNCTIYLNECSQIPQNSRDMAATRLAQLVQTRMENREPTRLKPRMYYDCNPPSKAHWSYRMFVQKVDPESKMALSHPDDYASFQMNPEDNTENLAPGYLDTLAALSPRLRKRFLKGEFADATPNQLFADETIEKWRVLDGDLPDFIRVVVGVDPSGSGDVDNADNDAIGIVVAALGTDGNAYLLEDCTVKAGPATWGKVATDAYDRHEADVVVGEVNYGGAMVQHTIQTARRRTPYKAVTATRGKAVRAEPISALYEQGKVRHVGYFRELEDELTAFSTVGYLGDNSPNRADAAIWALTELFPGVVAGKKEKKPDQGAGRVYVPRGGAWMQ